MTNPVQINYLWLYRKVSGLMVNYMNNCLEHVQNFLKLWVVAFVDPSLRHQLQWLDQDDTLVGKYGGGVCKVVVLQYRLVITPPETPA